MPETLCCPASDSEHLCMLPPIEVAGAQMVQAIGGQETVRRRRGAGLHAGLHAALARALVLTFQRCHGYEDARLPMGLIVDAAPPAPASEPAPAPAPTPSGPTWRELDRAYLAHHQQCTACQCAGRGYGQRCAISMQLWTAYSMHEFRLEGIDHGNHQKHQGQEQEQNPA